MPKGVDLINSSRQTGDRVHLYQSAARLQRDPLSILSAILFQVPLEIAPRPPAVKSRVSSQPKEPGLARGKLPDGHKIPGGFVSREVFVFTHLVVVRYGTATSIRAAFIRQRFTFNLAILFSHPARGAVSAFKRCVAPQPLCARSPTCQIGSGTVTLPELRKRTAHSLPISPKALIMSCR